MALPKHPNATTARAPRKLLPRASTIATLFLPVLSVFGCHDDDAAPVTPAPPGVTHCVDGAGRALKAPSLEEMMSVYYDQCADLYSEAACRDAWHTASHAPVADQLRVAAEGCRKAYCPSLGSFAFDICKDGFVATPDSLSRTWPAFSNAIVEREAGNFAPLVTSAMLGIYARSVQLKAQSPTPADSASASPTLPVPSGSTSASAAPPLPSAARSAPVSPLKATPKAAPSASAH